MQAYRLLVGLVLMVGLGSCGGGETSAAAPTLMPDVVGQQLDAALSEIEGAGIEEEVEVLGGGTFGVLDESNWTVCEQSPAAGAAVDGAPQVTVDRSCGGDESEPSTSEQPEEEPAEEPVETDPPPPAAQETLTAENSEALATLLATEEECESPVQSAFAANYAGRKIEFDGNVADLAPHGSYDTRFDFLIYVGDFSETSASGPSFKFEDVSAFDLGVTGGNPNGEIKAGDNLRIVAVVESYNPTNCLFFLDPVSVRLR